MGASVAALIAVPALADARASDTATSFRNTRTLEETPAPRGADRRGARSQRREHLADPVPLPAWVFPAEGPISSRFAARWGTFHYGLDVAAGYGTEVRAASGGVVVRSGWYGGYGQIVIIDHGNGVTTRYAHNSALLVSAGQPVEAGTPIARVGSTGQSTGPHSHFEVRINDEPTDPTAWLTERDAALPGVDPNR